MRPGVQSKSHPNPSADRLKLGFITISSLENCPVTKAGSRQSIRRCISVPKATTLSAPSPSAGLKADNQGLLHHHNTPREKLARPEHILESRSSHTRPTGHRLYVLDVTDSMEMAISAARWRRATEEMHCWQRAN